MKLTYELIENWYETESLISDKIKEIASCFAKHDERLRFSNKTNWGVTNFDIKKDITNVSINEWWAYGGSDDHYIEFPTQWLFDFDYEKELIKQKEERMEIKRIDDENKKKIEDEKEKQMFLNLKNKFEK